MNSKHRQSGQIIVLFAIVLVGLLAFAGLAIDGAMVYSDRRVDQNTADSAAMAGAGAGSTYIQLRDVNLTQDFKCANLNVNGSKMNEVLDEIVDAAISRAGANGIIIDNDISDNNGVNVTCGNNTEGKYLDVEVRITTETDTSFIHIFGGQPLVSTVSAVARIIPSQPALTGYAIYVLDDNCSNDGISFKGGGNANPSIDITDGGAFSRSCLNGNNNSHSFIQADTAINCLEQATNYACGTTGQFSPAAKKVKADPLSNFAIEIPDCSDRTIAPDLTPSGKKGAVTETLEPGYYGPKTDLSNALYLKPGLYCIDTANGFGKDLQSVAGNGYNEGVTIVFMNAGADYKYTGQTHWNLKAPKQGANNAPNVIPGAVVVSDVELDLYFNGNAETSFWGTVYMPKAHLTLGGTADTEAVASQIIVHDLLVHGTTTLKMKFDDSWFVQAPPYLSLQK